MTIPISNVVGVTIAIGATFPSRRGFGILNIVTAETGVIGIAERIRSYSNMDGVAADWSSSTEAYKAALAYFSQQPKPTALKISTRYPNDQPAQLRGSSILDNSTNLALFTGINDGSFSIYIDGDSQDITGLDFTSDADMDDIASTVQTALQAIGSGGFTAATCTHDGSRFFINTGTIGASSEITFAVPVDPASGTDVSALLGLTQGLATKVDGTDAETISDSLDAIQNVDDDWYGLMFTKEIRDSVTVNSEAAVLAAADWCEARVKLFANTTNNNDVLDSVISNDIASQLVTGSYRRTITTFSSYPSEYPSASLLGRAFTVNFSQPNSTITLKFKQLPTITVEDFTQNKKTVLDSKKANVLLPIGDSTMYSESKMADGTFFDEVHGVDWLQNAIETNVFGYLLTRTTKVPYTDKGVAALQQQVVSALDEAVRNGLISSGETIDGEFLPNGYKVSTIPVSEMNQSDKESRIYNGISFVALGAGAIHGIQITGVFER